MAQGAEGWELLSMLEEALSAGIMRFDTCARGVAAPTPSVLLAALAAAGEEQAVDEGAERAQEAVSSAQSLAGSCLAWLALCH